MILLITSWAGGPGAEILRIASLLLCSDVVGIAAECDVAGMRISTTVLSRVDRLLWIENELVL